MSRFPASGALVDEQGRVACGHCEVAQRTVARIRGLMGRASLEQGHGMLIARTGSIHTFFMRFPIDAVFLDRDLRVKKVVHGMKRRRIAASSGARSVLELPAGDAARAGIEAGAKLAWRQPPG